MRFFDDAGLDEASRARFQGEISREPVVLCAILVRLCSPQVLGFGWHMSWFTPRESEPISSPSAIRGSDANAYPLDKYPEESF